MFLKILQQSQENTGWRTNIFIEHLGGCFWVTGTTTSLKLHSPGGKYRSSFRILLEFYPRNIITEIKKEMTRPGKVTLLYTTIN